MVSGSRGGFYSEKELRDIADELDRAVTVAVNEIIEADHRVFDFSEVERILREARRIAVSDCGCRSVYGNCDAPRDVCLALDDDADRTLTRDSNSKEITVNEALEVLRRSHEAGLVHMAYVMKGAEKPGLICSCCSCCCHTLGGLLKYGIHTQVLTSKYVADETKETCIDCGKCVYRCVFGARWMEEGVLHYDCSRCYGCGLCVTTCPTDSILMTFRG